MRRPILKALCLLLAAMALPAAAGTRILLVARDNEDHPVSGLRFAYQGVESKATNQAGATELDLPPEHPPGKQIKVLLVSDSKQPQDWFLVNPQVNIPEGSASAELVLMRRRTFRQIAGAARDASRAAAARPDGLTAEDRKRALVEESARHGLTAEQLETAIHSFAETHDPKDRGIAAYLGGQFPQAEELLSKAARKQETDFVETLRYLGAAQYEQGKYRASADTTRRALTLRSEDADLLGDLGESLNMLAEWTEAELLIRHALALMERKDGSESPGVAMNLNNLASLLLATNRIAEAEPLFRRALAIDEKNFGPENPKVALILNNLAVLLGASNRVSEAEPLLRRALSIDEKSYGPEHLKVGMRLSNLAQLLNETNRFAEAEPLARRALAIAEKELGTEHANVSLALNHLASLLGATKRFSEAEPLVHRALAIDERTFGPEHPQVASDLTRLAWLLQHENRCIEAETLARRALSIHEKSFGPEHPEVAADLSNLAQLLQATNRCGEAERMMRRALYIDEKSFGPEHPSVAANLYNLSYLLHDTNRLAEAEPLIRRALFILLEFKRNTGHEHPHYATFSRTYRRFLKEMDKSDVEIEAMMEAFASPSR